MHATTDTSGNRNDQSKAPSMDLEPSETSPLLSANTERGSITDIGKRRRSWQSPRVVILITIVIVILVGVGDQLSGYPQTKIYESIICFRFYERENPSKINVGRDVIGPGALGGVDEVLCKVDAVQNELAMINAYQRLFDGIPSLLLTVPFGWAADKFGRWPFIFMNLIGVVLKVVWTQLVTWNWQAFDIRAVWYSSILNFFGGGDPTLSALLFVTISDITHQDERAAVFLRAGAASLLGTVLVPPVAAWLMAFNPWIPSLSGTVFMAVSVFAYLLVPETLGFSDSTLARPSPCGDTTPASHSTSKSLADRWKLQLIAALSVLTNDWRVPVLVLPFLGHMLVNSGTQLLVQYISKRYALTLAEGTFLMTIRNGVNVGLLFIILPAVSTAVMAKFGLCGQRKDLYLAQASQVLVAMGWTFVAASPNIPTVVIGLVIASLGTGTMLLIRSFLTSLVPPHHIARVYSVISVMDTLGSTLGAPLLASLFKRGMALGGGWIGLPYYFAGGISALFAGMLFAIPLRKGEQQPRNEEEA